jgi:hypothetical protein
MLYVYGHDVGLRRCGRDRFLGRPTRFLGYAAIDEALLIGIEAAKFSLHRPEQFGVVDCSCYLKFVPKGACAL